MDRLGTVETISPGMVYEHFKGGRYVVLCIARHSESKEFMIIYREENGDRVWARPAKMFLDTVIRDAYTGPRFKRIEKD